MLSTVQSPGGGSVCSLLSRPLSFLQGGSCGASPGGRLGPERQPAAASPLTSVPISRKIPTPAKWSAARPAPPSSGADFLQRPPVFRAAERVIRPRHGLTCGADQPESSRAAGDGAGGTPPPGDWPQSGLTRVTWSGRQETGSNQTRSSPGRVPATTAGRQVTDYAGGEKSHREEFIIASQTGKNHPMAPFGRKPAPTLQQ